MTISDRLGEVLDIGDLPALRGIREVRSKPGEVICRFCATTPLGNLGRLLQVRGDLLCDLLVLGSVRLLKALERVQSDEG